MWLLILKGMTMKWLAKLMLCWMISFTLIEVPLMKSAYAGNMIATSSVVDQMSRTQDQQRVTEFMGRQDVQDQLIKLGVRPDEAAKRVASLSDREMRKIAGDIEAQNAGGSVFGILAIVLIVILIIYFAKRI